MNHLQTYLYIAIGGALGSVMRYTTSLYINRWWPNHLPLGTWMANVLGSLVIGIAMGYFGKHSWHHHPLAYMIITGFCGGYTTFSTFAAEDWLMIENGQIGLAAIYILLHIISCISMVAIGYYLSHHLWAS